MRDAGPSAVTLVQHRAPLCSGRVPQAGPAEIQLCGEGDPEPPMQSCGCRMLPKLVREGERAPSHQLSYLIQLMYK